MLRDEEIAEKRYWERRKKYTGIETGIYSGNKLIEFSESLLYDRIGVVLPKNFQDMPLNKAKKKYPSEERPQIIKTNEEGSINFAFNLLEQKIEIDQLESVAHDFIRVMKRLSPTNICLKIESGQGRYLPYSSAEFTCTAINEALYNMVVIIPISERLFIMLFNCPYYRRTEWTCCLSQIRERIIDYSEEELYGSH